MKENFIIIENVSEKELRVIITNLADLYSDNEFAKGIQLYQKKGNYNSFLILFSNSPDFDRFNYALNYLKYPVGFNKFSPFIRGFYQTRESNLKADYYTGDWIMVFVSKNDKNYDNVIFVNEEDENYLFDFGGKIRKLDVIEEKFKMISVDKIDFLPIINISPTMSAEDSTGKPWWKFW
jgi:hypothetical protein